MRQVLDFLNDELEVDQMMISPAYAYEKAPDQEHFLGVRQTRELFSEAFADGRRKRWRLNHSPLFLDFLEGKVDFECTAWGIPSYSLFGWQRPCYLMADGYAEHLQGADRDHRLGRVRTRARSAVRQLHGALRLRADGRAGLDQVDQAVGPRRAAALAPGGVRMGPPGPTDAERSEAQEDVMSAETKRTTDHETIRKWAEDRAGVPATVRGTEEDDDPGVLRIDFPEGAGEESLEHISWDEWFRKFDESDLCFLYQEEKATGEGSMFFKLISE